jgi:tRNA G18 (ribose-2'-O)-methylase SpoU
MRGFFAIGIYHTKTESNVGGLWRSASAFGAAFVFTIGRRYRPQATDTPKTPLHTPLLHFVDVEDLATHLPHGAPLIGVEQAPRARSLPGYGHPERACYLLGAEDHGLPPEVLTRCHSVVEIPGVARCLNVASAGTVVLYDRAMKLAPSARQKAA